MSVELVSAVAVGFAIGWGFDQLLDTSPWFMVVLTFLGFGAGVMNVYRMAVGMNNAIGYSGKDDASQTDKVEETP
ncbi:MAG: AtpZ/AtpI family protein [Rhodospirillales bacterium]